jgi:hypothetical protein
MRALHSHLFSLPPELMHESADWRVCANNTVDRITSGVSKDPEADWAKLEDELGQCCRSIKRGLASS